KSTWHDLFEGQLQHAAIALLMTFGALSLLSEPAEAKTLFGLTVIGWAKLSIALALIHQIIVAFVFRAQLHKNLMTRLFGERDMKIWAVIFLPLLVVRPLTIIMVGWADATPLTGYRGVEVILGLAILVPAVWAMHSTLFHFTLPRALGGDHFRDEYLAMPMVDKGVFKYTKNGMYGIVFFGLTAIALLFGSWNALVVAFFHHAYIWVHMYCTESQDLKRMFP
ncbi:MAG: protein-S-isoprenylcysteine O-methyltransferase Ste14, partial [Paracoccaceae bacterium]